MTEPERVVLSPENFARLLQRLSAPGRYDPRIARVLMRRAPWDDEPPELDASTRS